jgi:hypothetical protein
MAIANIDTAYRAIGRARLIQKSSLSSVVFRMCGNDFTAQLRRRNTETNWGIAQ